MDLSVPLVIVGDVKGNLDKAIAKLLKVKKSMTTPECEETIFVCGDFFGEIPPSCNEYIIGSKKVPLHIYVLGPVSEKQSNIYSKCNGDMSDIFTNVTYLGKYGVLTLSQGLTVAYLSGIEDSECKSWTFTEENVESLIKKCQSFRKIDLLITYQWPLNSPFLEHNDKSINGVFFDTSSSSKRKGTSSDTDLRKKRNIDMVVDPKSCWFCMGNPDVDRSLIIAVADHVYLTLAKGPVDEGHVIILPIKHIEKMTDAPSGVEIETHRFLEAMAQYYETQGKQLVWFERCYKSPHLQINAIPIDPSLLSRGIIDKHLSELALQKRLDVRLFNLRTVVNLRKNITSPYYFYLQIGVERGYLIDITRESDFPINFGRKIIAQSLGVPEREFWKNCIEGEESVSRAVFTFRKGFEPFNFTLTD
ncbi:hypothetical protein GE061_001625 [Apolygus lucorum]|uniref:Cwf19-like C-terminal domain-containing protein n=1 Tax=Apolygus lucorum TaxID=248454 RepID=A0A8S9YAK4_APOLU|nr:hypothetical protein GE061_001625 [Apolygus lucorum]